MAEEHSVRGGQRQRVAGRFFPRQVTRARHQLLRLHAGELAERPVRGFIAPDALGGRKHRIAAVALFVVAVVLVAVDHDLIADLPALDLVTHRPDDASGVRADNEVRRFAVVKRADRLTKASPDAVVVDARRHHHDQHFVAIKRPSVDDLKLHRLFGRPVAFAANGPSIHLLWHMAQGRHFADLVEVLHRRIVGRDGGCGVQCHKGLLVKCAA